MDSERLRRLDHTTLIGWLETTVAMQASSLCCRPSERLIDIRELRAELRRRRISNATVQKHLVTNMSLKRFWKGG